MSEYSLDDVTYCSNCGSDRCCPTCGKDAAKEALAWAEGAILSSLSTPGAEAEHAVIKAAVASKDELEYVLKLATKLGVDYPELADLLLTVEAYEKAEEGGQ